MNTISLKKPIRLIFEGVLSNRTVYGVEIHVLKNGKPYSVCNKEGEKFNFEFLDYESKEVIIDIVERNKKIF